MKTKYLLIFLFLLLFFSIFAVADSLSNQILLNNTVVTIGNFTSKLLGENNISINLNNVSSSFVTTTWDSSGTGRYAVGIKNSTVLVAYKGSGTATQHVAWFVTEFGSGARVLHGNLTLAVSNMTIDLGTEVNLSKSFPTISSNAVTGDSLLDSFIFVNFVNTSTLYFAKTGTGQTELFWQVIEFFDNTTVQSGTTKLANNVATRNVGINSIGLTKSFPIIFYNASSDASADGNKLFFTAEITSSTNLQLSRLNTNSVGGIDISWYVVSLGSNNATSQLVSTTGVSVSNINWVDLNRSVIFVTQRGGGASYGYAYANFTNNTAVNINATAGIGAVRAYAVEFPNISFFDVLSNEIIVSSPTNITYGKGKNVSITYNLIPSDADFCQYEKFGINTTLTNGTKKCQNSTFLTNSSGISWTNFYVYANDTSGNLNRSVVISFSVDAEAPYILQNGTYNTTFLSSTVPVSFNTHDIGNNLNESSYKLDGVNTSLGSYSNFSLSSLSDGHHNLSIQANDTLLNENQTSVFDFTVDTTPSQIYNRIDNETFNNIVPLNYTYKLTGENAACYYELDGSPNVTLTNCNNSTGTFIQGPHKLKYYIVNSNGLINYSATANFTVAISGLQVTGVFVNQTYVKNRSVINISATVISQVSIKSVTVDIFNPQGKLNVTNASLYLQYGTVWAWNYTTNDTNGNWTFKVYINDTSDVINVSALSSFIVDTINPTPNITRTNSMAGVFMGINTTSFTINTNDTNAENWSIDLFNPSKVFYVRYNGSSNTTFQLNLTNNLPGGNWTINLTAQDKSGNNQTVSDWFGLANYTINDEVMWEAGNFTTVALAHEFLNDTATDMDYLRVSRISVSGICENCSLFLTYNYSNNFTGASSVADVVNNNNQSINFTILPLGNLTNISYAFNVSNQNISEDVRTRFRVTNSLYYFERPGVWLIAQTRNISSDTHVNIYMKINTTNFDSSIYHPQYQYCISGLDISTSSPSCSNSDTAVDVLDNNNGNNGQINYEFLGPNSTKNARRFIAKLSNFGIYETLVLGSVSGASPPSPPSGGGGGGGGSTEVKCNAFDIFVPSAFRPTNSTLPLVISENILPNATSEFNLSIENLGSNTFQPSFDIYPTNDTTATPLQEVTVLKNWTNLNAGQIQSMTIRVQAPPDKGLYQAKMVVSCGEYSDSVRVTLNVGQTGYFTVGDMSLYIILGIIIVAALIFFRS